MAKGQFVRVLSDKELTNEQGKHRDVQAVLSKSPTPKKSIERMLEGTLHQLAILRTQQAYESAEENAAMWNERLLKKLKGDELYVTILNNTY